jgi:hypothetical protein
MRLSSIILKISIVLGLILVSRSIFSRPSLNSVELLKRIDAQCLAAIKSAKLALEKSTSQYLREISQHLCEDLARERERLGEMIEENNFSPSIELFEMESYIFNYDYNEESPFDLAYASHQMNECNEIIMLLQQAENIPVMGVKDMALRKLSIFSRFEKELNNFVDNFMTVNSYRIREIAYQIWEREGRPIGEDKRHWAMAEELLKKISLGELQLAFEQKRLLSNEFSTTPDTIMNKSIH